MQDASSLRGDTVIQTLVNMSSEDCRDETATKTIGNIVGHDVPNDLNRAILDIVGAPDDLLGDTVVETIANMVRSYDSSAEVPDNVIDALVMLNEVSGGEPYSDGRNLFAISTASDGYIGAHGGYNASVNENHPLTSAFIPVKPGQSLVFQAWSLVTSNSTSSGNGNIWLAYCFYDSSKAAVGDRSDKYGGTILESGRAYSSYSITVPNGAAFIRVTYRRVLGGFAKLEYGDNATDWTPAPQDVEVVINEAYDCFANDAALIPPLRMTVFGRSVQNGTPAPNAPVPIESVEGNLARNTNESKTISGVTFTVNADGSITADGTATANAQFNLVARASANAYLLPDGSYALSGCPAGGGGSVYELTLITNPDGTRVMRDYGNGATYTFADGEGMNGCGLYIMIRSGQTVSGLTFRPMLVRGSVALPYVPCDHAGLWVRGRNLVNMASAYPYSRTQDGITLTVNADGSITVTGGTVAGAIWSHTTSASPTMFLPAGTYTTYAVMPDGTVPDGYCPRVGKVQDGSSISYSRGVRTFTLNEPTGVYVVLVALKNTVANNDVVRIMLQRGTTATPYQPYVESATTVPLAGHVLRSLPDGTRDFITVGQDGMVTLTQQVGELTLDGTEKWSASSTAGIVYNILSGVRLGSYLNDALCDRFSGSFKPLANMADPSFKIGKTTSGTNELLYIKSTSLMTSVADFKAWLANNPTTIIYPLAEPVTYDLGYIDVPSLPSPESNVSAVAGIQPTMTMRYIRN